jgi:hypothetical protein
MVAILLLQIKLFRLFLAENAHFDVCMQSTSVSSECVLEPSGYAHLSQACKLAPDLYPLGSESLYWSRYRCSINKING